MNKKHFKIKYYLQIVAEILLVVILVALTAYGISKDDCKKQDLYGTRDGKTFIAQDMSDKKYKSSKSKFVSLDVPLDKDIQEFTYYLCESCYIDFSFIMAVMEHESNFNPNAKSSTDDVGIMQINKINHKWLSETLGITDFTDPYQSIRAGVYIFRGLFEKYDDPSKVLMAYNMGEYGASVLWAQGVKNIEYSRKILARADEFSRTLYK